MLIVMEISPRIVASMNDRVNLLSSPMFIQSHSNGNCVNAFGIFVQTVLYFVVLNKIAKPDYFVNWAFFNM